MKNLIIWTVLFSFFGLALHAEIVVTQDKNGVITVSNTFSGAASNFLKRSRPGKMSNPQYPTEKVVPQNYLTMIKGLAEKHGVKESLILAVARAESGFNPFAVSPKGAVGIMQLMPQTARMYGVDDRYHAGQNLDAGVRHLKYLYDKYKDIPLTLAAYNAGEEAVKKYNGIPPYSETRTYVKRVMNFMGVSYSPFFNLNSAANKKIYKIVSPLGKITITDMLPSNVDGTVTVIE